jgi:hypothetical protein
MKIRVSRTLTRELYRQLPDDEQQIVLRVLREVAELGLFVWFGLTEDPDEKGRWRLSEIITSNSETRGDDVLTFEDPRRLAARFGRPLEL